MATVPNGAAGDRLPWDWGRESRGGGEEELTIGKRKYCHENGEWGLYIISFYARITRLHRLSQGPTRKTTKQGRGCVGDLFVGQNTGEEPQWAKGGYHSVMGEHLWSHRCKGLRRRRRKMRGSD